jgi:tetratricopeptide (TPR) repeat protein/DNA-directed RNA polymerase subunit RPC12/RpoP
MTSSMSYVCTLCNREFTGPGDAPIRCPHCLRRAGVVAVPEVSRTSRWQGWRPGRGALLVTGALLLVSALVALGLYVAPQWWSPGPDHDLEQFCLSHNVPCPTALAVELPEELSHWQSHDDVAPGMARFFARVGAVVSAGALPDRLFTAPEMVVEPTLTPTSLEAVALAWQAAQRAGLTTQPCCQRATMESLPYWQRPYRLCDGACRPIYEPIPGAGTDHLECLDARTFAAHFMVASAQLPLPARAAYRLFAAARELVDEPDFRLHLGALKVQHNAPEFGIEEMRGALADGASPGGYLLVGEALLGVGLPADALDAFDALLRVAPNAPEARLGKARCLGLLGRPEEAAPILEELVLTAPQLRGLYAALALSRRHQGDLEGAVEALRVEVAAHPDREYVTLLVDLLLESKQETTAVAELDSLYETHHRADLAMMAIEVTSAAGRDEEADERLNAALQRHPDNVELLYLTANRRLHEHEFAAAEEVLMRLALRDPENPQVLVDLTLARFGLERAGKQGARGARETARELGTRWPREVYGVARLLSEWQYWEETEKVLEDRLETEPRNRRLVGWLYFFYLAHDKPEKAAALRALDRPWVEDSEQVRYQQMFEKLDDRAKTWRHEQQERSSKGE